MVLVSASRQEDGGDQFLTVLDGEALQPTSLEFIEEQLDQIEPRRGVGHEVEVHARVSLELTADPFLFLVPKLSKITWMSSSAGPRLLR